MSYERFHRNFFKWHCKNFFNFRRAFSPREWSYVETCFGLAPAEESHSWGDGPHFSYYSYSHRVSGSQVNSSRLAYGTVTAPELLEPLALAVMDERGLHLDRVFLEDDTTLFNGIGWDFEAGHFKVYYRSLAIDRLPDPELQTMAAQVEEAHHPEGLVSFTFVDGCPEEKKIYVYPRAAELPEGAYAAAAMVTNQRGVVPQYDVSGDWAARLNQTGRAILARYRSLGQSLDTIAYSDPDNFTLYFPPRL